MDLVENARLDKTVVVVQSLDEPPDDIVYWASKTPAERLEALELMRQIAYGYDPATTRLERVLEIADLETGKTIAGPVVLSAQRRGHEDEPERSD